MDVDAKSGNTLVVLVASNSLHRFSINGEKTNEKVFFLGEED